MKTYVAYYRVSTKGQGISGLGIDSQKDIVTRYINKNGEIIKEFIEIESGKNDKRTELNKAIDYAKDNESILIIAKLDRLSRNVSFIFQLRDSGVDFVCADMPNANTLTIGIFATLAQYERELISERTKNALAMLKAKGIKLGSPQNLTDQARSKGVETIKRNAKERNQVTIELIKGYEKQNLTHYSIAKKLNNLKDFKPPRGKKFYPNSIKQLLEVS